MCMLRTTHKSLLISSAARPPEGTVGLYGIRQNARQCLLQKKYKHFRSVVELFIYLFIFTF